MASQRTADQYFVIGGDLNSKHPRIGCCDESRTYKAGRSLMGILDRFPHARLLNTGAETRVPHPLSSRLDAPSALDVSISSCRLVNFSV